MLKNEILMSVSFRFVIKCSSVITKCIVVEMFSLSEDLDIWCWCSSHCLCSTVQTWIFCGISQMQYVCVCVRACVCVCVCAIASADGQLKPVYIDSVAVERDAVLRQVVLCCLLNIVDLQFLDGIANHSESVQVGWPPNSCCKAFKLTYENPLFASVRLLFYLCYQLMCVINILMRHLCCIFYFNFA